MITGRFVVFSGYGCADRQTFSHIFAESDIEVICIFVITIVCVKFAHICSVLGMIELSIMVTGISQRGAIIQGPLSW